MATQGEAFLGEYLLPLITQADSVAFVEKPFRFLGGGQPSEFARSGWPSGSIRAEIYGKKSFCGALTVKMSMKAADQEPRWARAS